MRSTIRIIILCVLVFFIDGIAAAKSDDIPLWKRPKFEQLKAAESKVMDAEAKIKANPDRTPLNYLNSPLQTLGIIRTFVGDAFGGMESFDRWMELSNRIGVIQSGDLDRLEKSKAIDAIEAIVAEAKMRQIVILNESHQMPLHRAFAMRLARELRKIGYEYLACETFGENFESGVLKQSTGYYSREPMYANFLRDAASDGWKFVQYEVMHFDRNLSDDQIEILRESGEAQNIVAATFKIDSNAKVFIYVGHGHGMKTRLDSSQTKFMAEYLQNLTNIDPLSIDQTSLYEHSSVKFNHPLYALALQKYNVKNAFVLKSESFGYEVFGRYKNRVDIQVIHPRYKVDTSTQRFEWLSSLAQLLAQDVPVDLIPQNGRRVVYAYRINEYIDPVPVDAVLVEAGKPTPKLMLPKGTFRYTIEE